MAELKKLLAALEDKIGQNAGAANEAEGDEAKAKRFKRVHKLLLDGKAGLLDREPWQLAFEALEGMMHLLKKGKATPHMQALLSGFLGELLNSDVTEKRHQDSVALAYRILGHQVNGRPSKKRQEINAAVTYEMAIGSGASDEIALNQAWLAYHDLEGADASQVEKKMNRPAGEGSTYYKQSLEKTVIPLLHKAGVRKPRAGGRPRKTPPKT